MNPDVDGMRASAVLAVLDALDAAGCRSWLEGGWGVDALAGRQTRPHRDVDLDIDASQEHRVLCVLNGLDYRVETDQRPTRVELAAPGARWVDVTWKCCGSWFVPRPAARRSSPRSRATTSDAEPAGRCRLHS